MAFNLTSYSSTTNASGPRLTPRKIISNRLLLICTVGVGDTPAKSYLLLHYFVQLRWPYNAPI